MPSYPPTVADAKEYLAAGSPAASALYRENFSRHLINADNAIGATGLITAMAVYLCAGDIITKISVCVGATAGATLTNQYVVLYSGATIPLTLAQSTATANAAMAANTVYTGTLSATYTVLTSGLYWAGVCITGTTIPTLS